MFEGTLQRDEGKTDSIDKNSTRELQQQTCLISHSPLDGSCAFITRFCRSSTRQHSFVDKNATRQAEISVGENPSLTFVGRRRQETCWLLTWKQRRQQFDWRHLLTDLTFSTRRTDGWLTYSSIRGLICCSLQLLGTSQTEALGNLSPRVLQWRVIVAVKVIDRCADLLRPSSTRAPQGLAEMECRPATNIDILRWCFPVISSSGNAGRYFTKWKSPGRSTKWKRPLSGRRDPKSRCYVFRETCLCVVNFSWETYCLLSKIVWKHDELGHRPEIRAPN